MPCAICKEERLTKTASTGHKICGECAKPIASVQRAFGSKGIRWVYMEEE